MFRAWQGGVLPRQQHVERPPEGVLGITAEDNQKRHILNGGGGLAGVEFARNRPTKQRQMEEAKQRKEEAARKAIQERREQEGRSPGSWQPAPENTDQWPRFL